MMDFTNEEKERINQLYGNDFKNITPEDAQLIGRWEAWKAVNDAKHQAEMEALKTESTANLEIARQKSKKAMEDLEEIKNAALARLEALETASLKVVGNGQQE